MKVDEPPLPSLPDAAPAWLEVTTSHLWGHSDDLRWKSAVILFVNFEESLGFLDGKINTHMLGSGKYRPKEIGPWIRAAHVMDPTIKNAAAFGEQWWQWYLELQPERRVEEDSSLLCIMLDKADWAELSKGTINGVYSLLASLGWWLRADKAVGTCKAEILKVLNDVIWMLEAMTHAHHSKRASPSPDADEHLSKKARAA